MLTSAAVFALASAAYRSRRAWKWDWTVFGVTAVFVFLYTTLVTCVVRRQSESCESRTRRAPRSWAHGSRRRKAASASRRAPSGADPSANRRRRAAASPLPRRPCDPFSQILPWLGTSVTGMANLTLLTLSTALALWCFACCCTFDPGRCARRVCVCLGGIVACRAL